MIYKPRCSGLRSAIAIFAAVLSVSALQAADAPATGFADAVLGRWDITVNGSDGAYPSWMEIRLRTEDELMAEFVGRFGSRRHAASVTYTDNQLELRMPVQYEQGGDELVFSGTFEQDRLFGRTRLDDGESVAWHAARAPSLRQTGTREWDSPIALLAGGLSAWTPRSQEHSGCWSLVDGVLSATPPCVDLISNGRYEDFSLTLEFRYPAGSNSGVYLRGRYEVQIQDDRGKALDPLRLGGVYGFIAPALDAAGRPGEWQSMTIELTGRRISVSLNGSDIIVNREIPGITGGALDSEEGSAGPLMLQGDHGPIEFRNIVLTPAR